MERTPAAISLPLYLFLLSANSALHFSSTLLSDRFTTRGQFKCIGSEDLLYIDKFIFMVETLTHSTPQDNFAPLIEHAHAPLVALLTDIQSFGNLVQKLVNRGSWMLSGINFEIGQ